MAVNMHMENGESDPAGPAASGSGHSFPPPGPSEDNVRAPIPQKQETLVEPGFEGYEMSNRLTRNNRSRVRSVFDGFRNFEEETLRREREEPEEQEFEVLPKGYSKNKK